MDFSLPFKSLRLKKEKEQKTATAQLQAPRAKRSESLSIAVAWAEKNAEVLRNPTNRGGDMLGSGSRPRSAFLEEQILDLQQSIHRGDGKGCSIALRGLCERAICSSTQEGLKIFLAAESDLTGLALTAIERDEPEMLGQILQAGADANTLAPNKQSLLRIALSRLQPQCVEKLLKFGAKTESDERSSPAHWLASAWYRPDIAATLYKVTESADRKSDRNTRGTACLRALHRFGAPMNELNLDHRTPLSLVVSGLCDAKTCWLWLASGALAAGVPGQTQSPKEALLACAWRAASERDLLLQMLMDSDSTLFEETTPFDPASLGLD